MFDLNAEEKEDWSGWEGLSHARSDWMALRKEEPKP